MYFRKQSKFAQPSSFCGINALLLFILSLIIHYLDIIGNNLYYIFIIFSFLLAIISIILAILTIIDLWCWGYKGALKALRAFLYSIIVLIAIIYGYFAFFVNSTINDVSTDINNPPQFLTNCYNLSNTSLVTLASINANRYDFTIEEVIKRIKILAKAKDWKIIKEKNDLENYKNYYIELIHKSWIGGFSSNLVVRLHKEDSKSVFIDSRARSCNLKSDAGLSDKFINKFMQYLDNMLIIGDIN